MALQGQRSEALKQDYEDEDEAIRTKSQLLNYLLECEDVYELETSGQAKGPVPNGSTASQRVNGAANGHETVVDLELEQELAELEELEQLIAINAPNNIDYGKQNVSPRPGAELPSPVHLNGGGYHSLTTSPVKMSNSPLVTENADPSGTILRRDGGPQESDRATQRTSEYTKLKVIRVLSVQGGFKVLYFISGLFLEHFKTSLV